MWLLNTTTYQLYFVQDPSITTYAILSHVWSQTGEQTFQDLQAIHAAARSTFDVVPADDDPALLEVIRARLSPKIRGCCDYARVKGFSAAWIDACCIDKTSSAELSEAINSMFEWYSLAEVCYVFLADVSATVNPHAPASRFRWSVWFTRGWTLQELVVPWRIVFLSKEWQMIGTKSSLANVIRDITGIDRDVLLRTRPLHTVSVAQRMSWASGRRTTRREDEAYCLMGIFGVHLTVIYGEGSQASIRLQEEILKCVPDQSIFAWGLQLLIGSAASADPAIPTPFLPMLRRVPIGTLRASKGAYLLACSPADFAYSAKFSPVPFSTFYSRLGIPPSAPPLCLSTGHGIRTTFPVRTFTFLSKESPGLLNVQLAILACEDSEGRLLALILSGETGVWDHFTSGYDGENGFRHHHDGIVEHRRNKWDFAPSLCLTECRPSWPTSKRRRRMRADSFPHSKQYPRLALLDPSIVDSWASGHTLPAGPVLREVCIPCHRLQSQSALAIYGPEPPSILYTTLDSFQFMLPSWTLHHFRTIGVVVDGLKHPVDQDLTHADVVKRHRGSRGSSYFVLKLSNVGPDGVVVIHVFPCPARRLEQFHATVKWVYPPSSSSSPRTLPDISGVLSHAPVLCVGQHVKNWKDGKKCYEGPTNAHPSVTLQFSQWDLDELDDGPCYALSIIIGVPGPTASDGQGMLSDAERKEFVIGHPIAGS